ncbi:hypothetical protein [uncultured Arthrobacter sp.]|uniref:hypothetical protein n=1 Tax=uncultured Arthrobacter sp. TaxID=114050 RepID=UPI002628ECC7|nr:hypothetical protein [uncultured Arthrobacter sp.]
MSTDKTQAREGQDPEDDRTDGAGPEGTIPAGEDGVAAGSSDEPSHFEPEEDESGSQQ